MITLNILGSTGSIGTQALRLVEMYPERFRIGALTAHRQSSLLFEQVRRFRPAMAGLTCPIPLSDVPEDLRFCTWVMGEEALSVAAAQVPCDQVLVSVVGIAGLQGVMDAIGAGRQVLLANKEALVTGGALVMEAARQAGKPLLPVDSEHSAIFQCLQGAGNNPAERILLTASGGPFRTWTREEMDHATPAQALRHPNWSMGSKITIDSATMFNKALEMVEAHWLFDMPADRIQVLVHPQSVVHSAVVFRDGAVIAQLGVPDMALPILYAMAYPERLSTGSQPLDLTALNSLTFEPGDPGRFPALRLGAQCIQAGGTACTVLNGANEEAVAAFLREEISFGAISRAVEETLLRLPVEPVRQLSDVFAADEAARRMVRQVLAGT